MIWQREGATECLAADIVMSLYSGTPTYWITLDIYYETDTSKKLVNKVKPVHRKWCSILNKCTSNWKHLSICILCRIFLNIHFILDINLIYTDYLCDLIKYTASWILCVEPSWCMKGKGSYKFIAVNQQLVVRGKHCTCLHASKYTQYGINCIKTI